MFSFTLVYRAMIGQSSSITGNLLSGKVCIVTGATSGIGKETAIGLARLGAVLVLPVRNLELGESVRQEVVLKTGNSKVDIMPCDLVSFISIMSFAKSFLAKYDCLHVLIHNAGIMETVRKVSRDGIELTFAVNHLAPFLLTKLLLDVMKTCAPARIITVSSEIHKRATLNFNDIESKQNYNGLRAYGQSKLANILFTRKLAQMLVGTGVTANVLHPGVVGTNLFKMLPAPLLRIAKLFLLTPEQGAATTLYLATSPDVENITGEYFNKKKVAFTSGRAQDAELADRLWELSEQYISV